LQAWNGITRNGGVPGELITPGSHSSSFHHHHHQMTTVLTGTPGWKYSEEFLGAIIYQEIPQKSKRSPSTSLNSFISFRINLNSFTVALALFAISYGIETFVVVLDGTMKNGQPSYCIQQVKSKKLFGLMLLSHSESQGQDGFYHYCELSDRKEIEDVDQPTLLPERAQAIGFISSCPIDNDNCQVRRLQNAE